MSQFDKKMTELVDAIKGKNTSVSGKLSVQEMIDAVRGITAGSGDAGSGNVKFGYWTEDGQFQEIDLSGESPQDTGNPIAADVVTFETGKPAPDYNSGCTDTDTGGGGETQFYLCTGYDGVVDVINITSGSFRYEWGEDEDTVDLTGSYTIVDPAAFGTDRKWYCAEKNHTIGCMEVWTGDEDENGNYIYEKYWAIASGQYLDEESPFVASNKDIPSPFQVEWETQYITLITPLQMTSAVTDVSPYGASGWSGIPIVKTDKPVLVSYGAGLDSANGFWEQTKGEGISVNSQWQLIGTDSVLKDNNPDGEYHYWHIHGTYPAGDYYGSMYNQTGDAWRAEDVQPPSMWAWQAGSSDWKPAPTFLYSKTGGYFPEGEAKSQIPFHSVLPKIGSSYNSGATIKVEVFIPEQLYDPETDKEETK